jgi:hypothetical protein
MSKPIQQAAEQPAKTKTAAQILEEMRDRRHDPDKALALIKAAHAAGGRPVDFDHAETVRNGFVEVYDPNEIRMKREGKIGYRTKGATKGPLRNLSSMERRLVEKERDFLTKIAKFTKLDNAMMQLEAKQKNASALAVQRRRQRADEISAIIVEMYNNCHLSPCHRAGYITRKLAAAGQRITERRVHQIISAQLQKNRNDGD